MIKIFITEITLDMHLLWLTIIQDGKHGLLALYIQVATKGQVI